MLAASLFFAALLSYNIIFSSQSDKPALFSLTVASAAGLFISLMNFLWRKLYKRKIYENGVIKQSDIRKEFVAAKGYFIKWILLMSVFLLPLFFTLSIHVAIFVICSPFTLLFGLLAFQNIRLYFQRGPILIVADHGLEYRGYRHFRIEWDDIVEAAIRNFPMRHDVPVSTQHGEPTMYLVLTVKGNKSLIRWYNIIKQIRYRMHNEVIVAIDLNTVEASVKEVSDVISQHIDVSPSVDWRWKDDLKC